MKRLAKLALGAAMLAGATAGLTAPAAAHVSIGFGIGVPGPGYYGPPPSCDPYSRYYDPYYCDDGYYRGAYYDGPPLFVDGAWLSGPTRWRNYGGHREFYVHGGWHGGSFHGGHGGGGFRHR